jgi:hypothetical protein
MAHEPKEVAVLNTIQAVAADAVLSGGKFNINDGSDDLTTPTKLVDGIEYEKTAYAAGTPSVKDYDYAGVALLANSQYRVAVVIPSTATVAGSVSSEADELIPIREYIVWTDSAPASASALVDLLVARINLDSDAKVTASNAAGELRLTLNDVATGDFRTESDGSETVVTPYVAPSGTPAIVEALAPTKSSPTAEYTTYRFDFNDFLRNNAVSGGKVAFPAFLYVFADETAANFAAFDAEMDAIFGGTHTPVADYLGV